MKEQQSMETSIALLQADMVSVKNTLKEMSDKLDNKYVTKEEFATVKNIVYGAVILILVAFMGAVIYFFIPKTTNTTNNTTNTTQQ